MSDAVETSVAAHLGAYDKTHAPLELQEAADAAARFDGATWPDAQANLYAARARVADWVAILARVKRDLDPAFDPKNPPSMNISPPGEFGDQYAPGVNPRDVKDPAMRAAYIEAIAKNQQRIEHFTTDVKLAEAQTVVRERAARSIHDARTTLGLSAEEASATISQADLLPADRAALLAAAR